VALLHLERMAAISAVEGHLIELVNGRFGPFEPMVDRPEDAFGLSVCNATVNGPRGCGFRRKIEVMRAERGAVGVPKVVSLKPPRSPMAHFLNVGASKTW
jgi:hypothetical protein